MTRSKSLFHSQPPLHKKPVLQLNLCEPSQTMSVWLPRNAKHPASEGFNRHAASNQPSYVYFFVHATENRLKIGESKSPVDRLAQLPEAGQVDWTQSLLHNGLAEYSLQLAWLSASGRFRTLCRPWDGVTEWFSLVGHASCHRIAARHTGIE